MAEWGDSRQQEKDASPSEETHRQKWLNVLVFSGFSSLSAYVLYSHSIAFEKWQDYLVVLGAIFSPVMALVSLKAIQNNSAAKDFERKLARTLWWMIAAPIILALVLTGIALVVGGASSLYDWFESIPSWAAVIIVLLFLMLVRDRR